MKYLLAILLLCCLPTWASERTEQRLSCTTFYSVVTRDKLGNLTQGASDKELKKLRGNLSKKYPDVCYAAPDPAVKIVFFLSVVPATYHGNRVVSDTSNESGTITTSDGDSARYEGTGTSSTVVPYSFEYGRYMLTVETLDGSKVTVRRRFQQDGIFRTMYGIPLGGRGHHPEMALIEDAVKWIHAGGLEDPLQSSQ